MRSKNNEQRTPHLTRRSVLNDLGFSASEALEIKVKAELYRDLLHTSRIGASHSRIWGPRSASISLT